MWLDKFAKAMAALTINLNEIRDDIKSANRKLDLTNAKLDNMEYDLGTTPRTETTKCNTIYETVKTRNNALETPLRNPLETNSLTRKLRVCGLLKNVKETIERAKERKPRIAIFDTTELKTNGFCLEGGHAARNAIDFANVIDKTNCFSALNGFINVKLDEKGIFLHHHQ